VLNFRAESIAAAKKSALKGFAPALRPEFATLASQIGPRFGAGHTCRCPTSSLPCPRHPGTARLAAHAVRAASVAKNNGGETCMSPSCALSAPPPLPPLEAAPPLRVQWPSAAALATCESLCATEAVC
jgi:hypothetical protein